MVVYRSVIVAVLLLVGFCGIAQAADVEFTPSREFSSSISIQQNPGYVDLRGTGVVLHKLTWATSGSVTGGACALQGSVDNTFASPSTVISAQTVTSSGGPTAWTYANANFVRINCTTPITGTGTVRVTFNGINPKPVTDINGTPVSSVSNPCDGQISTPKNAIVASTTLVQILAKSTGKKNYGCAILVINNDATTIAHFSLIEGTQASTPCDTNAVAIMGSTTAGNGLPIAINAGGFYFGQLIAGQSVTQDWCIQNDGSTSVRVFLTEIQQ